jgi:hypothetical protein
MSKLGTILGGVLLLACQGADKLDPPMIEAVPPAVNLGEQEAGGGTVQFDIQIRNTGERKLEFKGVTFRGDQNCAFHQPEGPDLDVVGRRQAAFIRVKYEPQVRATDQVALQVRSNSAEKSTLRIPICARAVLPEEMTDAGVPDPVECELPPSDQPNCEQGE